KIFITSDSMDAEPVHIRRKGCQFSIGTVIAPKGKRLSVESLVALCEDGVERIWVARRPLVQVLCTGTELVSPGQLPGRGEKVSSNGILLSTLLKQSGAICSMGAPVADDPEVLCRAIREAINSGPDMIITTGGMGPGKYDFLERAFVSLGGEIHYNRLLMRPGKATLFGMLGKTAVFALPGPPPAVRLLYHTLVSTALEVLSGNATPEPILATAKLDEDIEVKRTGHLNLKTGWVFFTDGQLLVRQVSGIESMNAILHCPGDRALNKVGDSVSVHLLF
ncbi:MAG: molybdopterin-binding protein, partial [Desulfobulbaceae bacterium]|nr:molybdopterin-binding protein [Desulfobulbaceae bacterium]